MGGASKVMDNYRLFMVPGMGHCGGGDGTDTFDKRAVLEQWVEQKKAPDQIIASHMTDGAVTRLGRCARILRSRSTKEPGAPTMPRTSLARRSSFRRGL